MKGRRVCPYVPQGRVCAGTLLFGRLALVPQYWRKYCVLLQGRNQVISARNVGSNISEKILLPSSGSKSSHVSPERGYQYFGENTASIFRVVLVTSVRNFGTNVSEKIISIFRVKF